MLQSGKFITAPNDPLRTISLPDLKELIRDPYPELKSKINQLRILKTIDKQRYQQSKITLPYVTCGIFSPPYRRKQNFGSILYFILDIDNLEDNETIADTLKETLIKDERILLLFISPGGDGLKVMFRLTEKCYDPAKYSIFYKLFCHHFSKQYNLHQSLDKVTSDVSRACFLSYDDNVYYNPSAIPINIEAIIDFENESEVFEARKQMLDYEKEAASQNKEAKGNETKELPEDLLTEIKKKLNPNIRLRPEKQIFVPDEIDKIIPVIQERIESFNLTLTKTEPINFGKKLIFEFSGKWAQLNVFYGKNGYKVVKTPKTGSDKELAEAVFHILCDIFY